MLLSLLCCVVHEEIPLASYPTIALLLKLWNNTILCDLLYLVTNHESFLCIVIFFIVTPLKTIFGFPIFWFWAYLMEVIPETRRAH